MAPASEAQEEQERQAAKEALEADRRATRAVIDDQRGKEDRGEELVRESSLKDRLRARVQARTLPIQALDEEFEVRYPTMRQIQAYGVKMARAGELVKKKQDAEGEEAIQALEEQADTLAKELGEFAAWLCEPTHPELDLTYFTDTEEGLEVGMAIVQATTAAYTAAQEDVQSFRS